MLITTLCLLPPATSQEIARPSQSHTLPEPPSAHPANMQLGNLALDMDAALETEYVDNIYLSRDHAVSDVILHPQVGIIASWPLTRRNTLRLHTTFGYVKYLENSVLDNQQLTIAPDSALEFTLYSGDFRFIFHDQFALESETLYSGSLSGVASLPRFTNTAGVSVLWELADLELSAGYDHYNFITLGSAVTNDQTRSRDLSNLDHTTDQISASTSMNFGWGIAGAEATFAVSDYPDNQSAGFKSATAGPYLKWQVTRATSLQFSAGYKHYGFEGTPQPVFAFDRNGAVQVKEQNSSETSRDGYYANFSVSHRLSQFYSDHLELGHEDQVDALSGRTEINFARYSMSFMLNSRLTLNGSCQWQSVSQSAANPLFGEQADDFQLLNLAIGTGFRVTPHATVSLGYQYTRRIGDDSLRDYTQNRFTLDVNYNF